MPRDLDETGAAKSLLALTQAYRLLMAAATLTLKCLTIPAVAKHTATVVFVHVSTLLHVIMGVLLIIPSFCCRAWATLAMAGNLLLTCSESTLILLM